MTLGPNDLGGGYIDGDNLFTQHLGGKWGAISCLILSYITRLGYLAAQMTVGFEPDYRGTVQNPSELSSHSYHFESTAKQEIR